jgi:hypothetical protein
LHEKEKIVFEKKNRNERRQPFTLANLKTKNKEIAQEDKREKNQSEYYK